MFSTNIKKRQAKIISLLNGLSECTPEEKKQRIHSIQVLFAQELFHMKKYSQAMAEFLKVNIDPAEVIRLFPDLDSKSNEEKGQVKKIKAKDLDGAVTALINYLRKYKAKVLLRADKNCETETGITSSQIETSSGSRIETDSDIQLSVTQQLELIDTTLLKCYLQTNNVLVVPLLRANNCNLEEAEKALLQHGKHNELIILYQTKGQHVKALHHLRDHSKKQDSPLKGYCATIHYLQQLGSDHINLIIEFSDWILKEHPEEGLKIFTEDIEIIEKLPRPKILDFLQREHEALITQYLEHVIHIWNDTNSLFHDVLINRYKDKITDKNANLTEEEFQCTKSKLLLFLEKSAHYTAEKVILQLPTDSLFEERAVVLGKLRRHEEALAMYVFILGDIDQALRYSENVSNTSSDNYQDIYIILMRILINPEQGTSLMGPLVNVPRHPKTSEADIETALYILEKHVDKISPLKALSVFPDYVPLHRLKIYLESALDGHHTLTRSTQILKGLSYAENNYELEKKQCFESQYVVVHDDDACRVCRKRFRNQITLVRYPNGDIVHFSCKPDK